MENASLSTILGVANAACAHHPPLALINENLMAQLNRYYIPPSQSHYESTSGPLTFDPPFYQRLIA